MARCYSFKMCGGRVSTQTVLTWGVIGVFFVADLVWLPLSRLSIAAANGPMLAMTPTVIGVLFAVPPLLKYRVRERVSLMASIIRGGGERLNLLVYAAAAITALGIFGAIFSYLSTSLGLPLRDAELAAIDHSLGFDWPGFLAWTDARPWLATVLTTAYHTAGSQILLLFLFICATNRADRIRELLAINATCSLATGIGMTLIPAEGAYAFYAPVVHSYSKLAGMWHHTCLWPCGRVRRRCSISATSRGW